MYLKLNLLIGLLCQVGFTVTGDQLSVAQISLRDKFVQATRIGWQLRCAQSPSLVLQGNRDLLQQEIEKLRSNLTAVESKQAYQAAHLILQAEHSESCSCGDHK